MYLWMFDIDISRFHLNSASGQTVYKTGFPMPGAVLCSVRIHRIGQVTLTRNFERVLHVHQSTISANKDVSAKNINLGPGSYGHKVRGRKVRGRRVVGSG